MAKESWKEHGYVDDPVGVADIKGAIAGLKKSKNAVIMAHYYQDGDIQDVADYVGDSLALAQRAARTDADVIVMCGVNFMGETAKILCPDKVVIVPDLNAGCSLADSCDAAALQRMKDEHPGHTVISYVNTSARVKALTDIVVTSGNAVEIVGSLPRDEKIIFGPDRNLGSYINRVTGREMLLWDGACHVHDRFSLDSLLQLKREHPAATVLAHPECRTEVLELADVIGSTEKMLTHCMSSDRDEFIVLTEVGMGHRLETKCPGKRFHFPQSAVCGAMKMATLEGVADVLENMNNAVDLPSEVVERARRPVERMIGRS